MRNVESIAARFVGDGRITSIAPLAGGHINDSYVVSAIGINGPASILLQRINGDVFPNPRHVMENMRRVVDHLMEKLARLDVADVLRRVPSLLRTTSGESEVVDEDGAFWRCMHFIEGARTYQVVDSPGTAEKAGAAFGQFQLLLGDLPQPALHETIPSFHDAPARLQILDDVRNSDCCHRAALARREIEFAFDVQSRLGVLGDLRDAGGIPLRTVHNDAKISNVLFDAATGDALCVVDLDTVMPGLAVHDFGDMVRSMTSPAAEDEPDVSKVGVNLPLFEGVARGYLSVAGVFLSPLERSHLVAAAWLIAMEQGIRFLTDFLNGDRYYRTTRPHQNLDRCRTQFALAQSIDENAASLKRIIESS